jgi:hypothetical protein
LLAIYFIKIGIIKKGVVLKSAIFLKIYIKKVYFIKTAVLKNNIAEKITFLNMVSALEKIKSEKNNFSLKFTLLKVTDFEKIVLEKSTLRKFVSRKKTELLKAAPDKFSFSKLLESIITFLKNLLFEKSIEFPSAVSAILKVSEKLQLEKFAFGSW